MFQLSNTSDTLDHFTLKHIAILKVPSTGSSVIENSRLSQHLPCEAAKPAAQISVIPGPMTIPR